MAFNDSEINIKIKAEVANLNRALNQSQQQISSFKRSIGSAAKLAGGLFAADAVLNFGKTVLNTTAQFEKFEAVLTSSLGSSTAAQRELSKIQDIATTLPFSVAQLSGAFIKLNNQGLRPSEAQLRSLADVAAFTGKSIDQLAEAQIDAVTGEFERLKEFGIRAKKEGDKVTFTFREQATQVDFTAKAINDYIVGLGDLKGVAGSTTAISKTLGGQINNLGDAFDKFAVTLGNLVKGDASNVVGFLSNILNTTSDVITNISTVLGNVDISVKTDGSVEDAVFNLQRLQKSLGELTRGDNELIPNAAKQIDEVNKAIADQLVAIAELRNQDAGRKRFEELAVAAKKADEAIAATIPTQKSLNEQIEKLKDAQKIVGKTESLKIQAEIEGLEEELESFTNLVKKANTDLPVLNLDTKVGFDTNELQTLFQESKFSDKLKPTFDLIPNVDLKRLGEEAVRVQDYFSDIRADNTFIDPFFGIQFDARGAEIQRITDLLVQMQVAGEQNTEAFKNLNTELQSLTSVEALATAADAFGASFGRAMSEGENAAKAFANALRDSVLSTIDALLAQATAAVIANSANLGPAGIFAAVAGIAAVRGLFAAIPKFAEGGIVTGRTFAEIGEAGTEVIFPLSDLKRFIGENGGGGKTEVVGKLNGNDILISSKRSAARRAMLT